MANRKFTLNKNVFTGMFLFYCLIIITSFTGNNRARCTGNDQSMVNAYAEIRQPRIMMAPGPLDDTDLDGVLDGVDVDDDNDGIPDVMEYAAGLPDPLGDDNSNSILNYLDNTMPGFVDVNSDGIDDRYDMDRDGIINSYDLDMDGDGIPDVRETGLTDVNLDAREDGPFGTDGWSIAVAGMVPAFSPLDTDGDGLPDFRDIDSDADGITDNVEAQFTNNYVLPAGIDTDQDGIDDIYDGSTSHIHQGIIPVNFQGAVDVLADYIDIDTDDDGRSDLIEGHDANLDGIADYTPTGIDTDGDGLDDAFDLDNTGPNSRNEGMNEIPSPPFFDSNPPDDPPGQLGCRGPLQRTDIVNDLDRSWRNFETFILPLTLIKFTAERQDGSILLNWQSENETNFREYVLERSKDGLSFATVATIPGKGGVQALYAYTDNLGMQTAGKLYYRLKQVDNNERFVYSRILAVTTHKITGIALNLAPNPAGGNITLSIASDKKRNITITVFDNLGRLAITQRTGIGNGDNIIPLSRGNTLQNGMYTVIINDGEQQQSQKLLIQK